MDEGQPVAYPVLDAGVPVYARDSSQVGTVHRVIAAPEQDIFHGLVVSSPRLGKRFVPAEDIASLHERGVDLRISAAETADLPAKGAAAPEYREDPAATQWGHWARRLTGRGDWRMKR